MHRPRLEKIRISDLISHEATVPEQIKTSTEAMLSENVLKRPIVAHFIKGENKYLIIDGHHRVESLKGLGCKYVIANIVEYFSEEIRVRSWAGGKQWGKIEVIRSALDGRLMAPKSTKHVIVMYGEERPFHRNDVVEPVIDYPLSQLV